MHVSIIAALSIIVKILWNQLMYPTIDEWIKKCVGGKKIKIKKMCYIYTMKYCAAGRRDEFMLFY